MPDLQQDLAAVIRKHSGEVRYADVTLSDLDGNYTTLTLPVGEAACSRPPAYGATAPDVPRTTTPGFSG